MEIGVSGEIAGRIVRNEVDHPPGDSLDQARTLRHRDEEFRAHHLTVAPAPPDQHLRRLINRTMPRILAMPRLALS
jgi:hypothetical protein